MEDHTQLKNDLSNRERIRATCNYPSSDATIIISPLKSTVGYPKTCFICGSEDHFIANFPKPETLETKVHWNMEDTKTHEYISTKIDKTLEKSTDKSEPHQIYASMACMTSNK